MDILSKRAHSRRELFFILLNNICLTISTNLPTIINININVSFFIKTKLNNTISSLLYNILIYIASKMIPTIPSHLRVFT